MEVQGHNCIIFHNFINSFFFFNICRLNPVLLHPVVKCYNKVVTIVANKIKTMRKEVLIMPQNYTPEFKKKIIRLHEEEGRTYKSITSVYGVSKASISKWCSQLREECQTSPEIKEEYDYMKEMLKLRSFNGYQTPYQARIA
ncbi:hypothetical protein E1963_04025 [Extibacter muris]|uniref:Transposase n=1 Tax=Extibacter muris TaxID=1796622 RepID=A0A4R4FGI3_9FIRM|nr:hypothetical protein E1963_04025 [Extibacter muris]